MYLTNFAGTPPTIVFASTSFDTAAPAATTALSPISLPGEWQHAPLSRHRGRVLWKHDGDSGLFRPEAVERN